MQLSLSPLSRLAPLALATSLLGARASAQFDYTLAFDVDQATWTVDGRFANEAEGDVDFWIARWTAGAYHTADYGRNITSFRAAGADGKELEVERVSDSHFRIAAAGTPRVVVEYSAQAISKGLIAEGMILDVESNRINDRYAYVNPVSLFGFVPGRMYEPYSLRVELPEGWKAATVMEPDDAGVYHVDSYYRFEDSPLFLSPKHVTVETRAGGKPLEVTVYGRKGEALEEVVEGCERIVEAAGNLMGGLPYDRYEFLIGFVPEAQGSGLEHWFSTLILLNQGSETKGIWGLVAHEFFHLWCAERIHVEAIREPDYTAPFETGTIWINESMTEYMTQHVLLRAGFLDQSGFFDAVGPNPMIDMYAGQLPSPLEVSRAAQHWGSMQDLQTFVLKMYLQGPRIVFALDMEMRRASEGQHGIVDLLRHLQDEYADEGKGFPEGGMLDIINEVAGGELDEFYERYIEGSGNPSTAEHVDVIGCEVIDGTIEVLPAPTEKQQAAFEDFFSIAG